MVKFTFQRGSGFTESDCGRASITNNKQMDCINENAKGWDVVVDGEFEGTFSTRKAAVEHVKDITED